MSQVWEYFAWLAAIACILAPPGDSADLGRQGPLTMNRAKGHAGDYIDAYELLLAVWGIVAALALWATPSRASFLSRALDSAPGHVEVVTISWAVLLGVSILVARAINSAMVSASLRAVLSISGAALWIIAAAQFVMAGMYLAAVNYSVPAALHSIVAAALVSRVLDSLFPR